MREIRDLSEMHQYAQKPLRYMAGKSKTFISLINTMFLDCSFLCWRSSTAI